MDAHGAKYQEDERGSAVWPPRNSHQQHRNAQLLVEFGCSHRHTKCGGAIGRSIQLSGQQQGLLNGNIRYGPDERSDPQQLERQEGCRRVRLVLEGNGARQSVSSTPATPGTGAEGTAAVGGHRREIKEGISA